MGAPDSKNTPQHCKHSTDSIKRHPDPRIRLERTSNNMAKITTILILLAPERNTTMISAFNAPPIVRIFWCRPFQCNKIGSRETHCECEILCLFPIHVSKFRSLAFEVAMLN